VTSAIQDLKEQYTCSLKEYLAGAGEVALERAYEIGRRAIAEGLGVLEMVEIHREAVGKALPEALSAEENARLAKASDFFEESLSPFEITHRGFQETKVLLRHVLQFSSVLAHELRAPLSSIMASAGMLQDILKLDQNSMEGKLLNNILAGAEALRSRLDDLMDLAAFQSGNMSIRTTPVNVAELLRALSQRLQPEAARAGIILNLELPDHLPQVTADARRLEQVVSNLVHNAIKFSPSFGKVDIIAEVKENALIVKVRDYGIGIAPDDQARLFQPYMRVEKDRDRFPGLGIGLALCRQLVEAHGGEDLGGGELGKGSTFGFSLPLASSSERWNGQQ